ncbi:branched-chain amino acid transaminase [Candidatus Saccharibacteria bacterium]|nr:branched-chain amino acid transaminase [Candidatus Saccharibacteria bacterium]MBI3337870.1 branched-chain amino acid transaminase [Candidatus Saccharibacteria bacterium]
MKNTRFNLNQTEVYLRDKFVPFEDANLSIASAPVLYGLSVYTVFSATWNDKRQKLYIFRLRDHYNRLVDSAKIMDFGGFVQNWSYQKFESTMLELIKRNAVKQDVSVRATVFIDELAPGTKMRGLTNSFSAYIYPMGSLHGKDAIDVCVSSWTRTPDNAIPPRAKVNGNYANAGLMKNEALLNGYDEAIAMDEHGHVAEGTVANLFIVRDGKLITPDGSTDILEGITRNSVLAIADSLKLAHEQRSVDRSELYLADEVFMCGSSAKITPVLSVDKRLIGDGYIGPITAKLMKYYAAVLRGDKKQFAHWLTPYQY